MVQAILAGRKTQTRRIIKPKYSNTDIMWREDKYGKYLIERQNDAPEPVRIKKEDGTETVQHHLVGYREIPKKYSIGEILWVREEHYSWGCWEDATGQLTRTGKQKRRFTAKDKTILYPDTFGNNVQVCRNELGWHKRIARFMPKRASRIWLEITDIRVERVQEISEEDAKAEGVEPNCDDHTKCPSPYCKEKGCQGEGQYIHYMRDLDGFPAYSAKESFESLWQKINGPESWEANPFCWAISFKALSTTGKPNP